MTLNEFLRTKTSVGDLCIIRHGGWKVGTAWIDNEDLFSSSISATLSERRVINCELGELKINAPNDAVQYIKVKYIDVE